MAIRDTRGEAAASSGIRRGLTTAWSPPSSEEGDEEAEHRKLIARPRLRHHAFEPRLKLPIRVTDDHEAFAREA